MAEEIQTLYDDPLVLYETLLHNVRKKLETNGPAQVMETSADGHRVTMAPTIKMMVRDSDGKLSGQQISNVQDVPIHFMSGGDGDSKVVHTHPVAKGDEGIYVCGSRGCDNWSVSGGFQDPMSPRMHNLSDAMFIPGVRSDPNKIKNYNPGASELRSNHPKGAHYQRFDAKAGSFAHHIDATDPKNDTDPLPTGRHIHQIYKDTDQNNKGKGHHDVLLNQDSDKHGVTFDGVKHKHTISLFDGKHSHTMDGNKDSPNWTTQINNKEHYYVIDKTGHKASTSKNITHDCANGTCSVTGNHYVAKNSNIVKNLGVGNVLTSAFANLGPTNFSGGFNTGALIVAADADGGLVQATMGLTVTGGTTTDAATFSNVSLLGPYANDTAAATGGIVVGGVYLTSAGYLTVRHV